MPLSFGPRSVNSIIGVVGDNAHKEAANSTVAHAWLHATCNAIQQSRVTPQIHTVLREISHILPFPLLITYGEALLIFLDPFFADAYTTSSQWQLAVENRTEMNLGWWACHITKRAGAKTELTGMKSKLGLGSGVLLSAPR